MIPPRILVSAILACLISQSAAEARLGEDFSTFLTRFTKTTKALKPLAQMPGVTTQNFTFEVNLPVAQRKASPGLSAGVTVSVINGKIVGQSMAFKMGNNVSVGQKLACVHGFSFAYEAIGKPMATNRDQAEAEFKAFCDAIDSAFIEKQYLRYKGYNSQVTIRSEPGTGNLLFAATPYVAPAAK